MSKPQEIDKKYLSVAFRHPSLCTRSGTCVGVCPTSALSIGEDYYPQLDASKCISCGKCRDVCPGESVDYKQLNMQVFGDQEDNYSFDGKVSKTYVAYSTDDEIRSNGAGGGVVTALLWSQLESGQIDGCAVTRMREDKPWLGEPFIARTKQALIQSQGSRYSIIPYNQIFNEIRKTPGRYALASLPCHTHGYRKSLQHDEELKDRISLQIGLFCGGGLELNVVPELLKTKGIKTSDISDFQFRGGEWPGKMRAVMNNSEIKNLHYSNYKDGAYNYFIGLYMPERCQVCLDGSNEFSDLSISDSWTRDADGNYKFSGHSRILVRTETGRLALQQAHDSGHLYIDDVSSDKSYQTHKFQTARKGLNAPLRLARWGKNGMPVPFYNRPIPASTTKDRAKEKVVSALLSSGKTYWVRYSLIKFLTSDAAIPLIKLRQFLKKRKYKRRK